MASTDEYRVELARRAEKDLRDLRESGPDVRQAIARLAQSPTLGHPLQGSLQSVRSLGVTVRGVAYRVAYVVDPDARVCTIFLIGPHEGFYAKAARRVQSLGFRRVHRQLGKKSKSRRR